MVKDTNPDHVAAKKKANGICLGKYNKCPSCGANMWAFRCPVCGRDYKTQANLAAAIAELQAAKRKTKAKESRDAKAAAKKAAEHSAIIDNLKKEEN